MSQENIFRILILVLMFSGFGMTATFRRKANQTGGDEITFEKENQLLLKLRNIGALSLYGSLLLYLIYPPLLSWGQWPAPTWVRWLGVGMMGFALPMLYWMLSNLGNNVTPTVITREEAQLVTSGPYRFIRHPMYTFGFIFIFGATIAAANGFMSILGLLTFIPLHFRTPLEEEHLIQKFGGSYKEYIKNTGRYLPKLAKRL